MSAANTPASNGASGGYSWPVEDYVDYGDSDLDEVVPGPPPATTTTRRAGPSGHTAPSASPACPPPPAPSAFGPPIAAAAAHAASGPSFGARANPGYLLALERERDLRGDLAAAQAALARDREALRVAQTTIQRLCWQQQQQQQRREPPWRQDQIAGLREENARLRDQLRALSDQQPGARAERRRTPEPYE
ncbi:hypothetical protein BDV95DRAFT_607576 [Massariosphaeria phaeospora]|uniref:Uncharacterized protein n=1 Tax=Massariosphaeria phaeospora TaxID=100035 RepID=A0A7C8M869_9PLEO|nr:hypothetical protein BDV95DRAFT_607576 [Massariosphaeria phaeospora]